MRDFRVLVLRLREWGVNEVSLTVDHEVEIFRVQHHVGREGVAGRVISYTRSDVRHELVPIERDTRFEQDIVKGKSSFRLLSIPCLIPKARLEHLKPSLVSQNHIRPTTRTAGTPVIKV